MHDQLCDVISYCACTCGICKTSEHNKIVIENPKKENRWRLEIFFNEFSSKIIYGLEIIAC